MGLFNFGVSVNIQRLLPTFLLLLLLNEAGQAFAATLESVSFQDNTLVLTADSPMDTPRWNAWTSTAGQESTQVFVLDLPNVNRSPYVESSIRSLLAGNPGIKKLMMRQTASGTLRVFLEVQKNANSKLTPNLSAQGNSLAFQINSTTSNTTSASASSPAQQNTHTATIAVNVAKPQATSEKPVEKPVTKTAAKPPVKEDKPVKAPAKVVAENKPPEKKKEIIITSSPKPQYNQQHNQQPIVSLPENGGPPLLPSETRMTIVRPGSKKAETFSLVSIVDEQNERITLLERQLKEKNKQLAQKDAQLKKLQAHGGAEPAPAAIDPELRTQLQTAIQDAESTKRTLSQLQQQMAQLQANQQPQDVNSFNSGLTTPQQPPVVAANPNVHTFKTSQIKPYGNQPNQDMPVAMAAVAAHENTAGFTTSNAPKAPKTITQTYKLKKFPSLPSFGLSSLQKLVPNPNTGKDENKVAKAPHMNNFSKLRSGKEDIPTPSWMQDLPPAPDRQLDNQNYSASNQNNQLSMLSAAGPTISPSEPNARTKEMLRKRIVSNPADTAAYWELKDLYYNEGRYPEAAEILENLLLVNAQEDAALFSLAEIYLLLAKPLEAQMSLETYRKRAPNDLARINPLQDKVNMALVKMVNTP